MSSTKNYDLDIDTTLGGSNASDYIISSQKAIKSYIDNSIPDVSVYQLKAQYYTVYATGITTVFLEDNSIHGITISGNTTFVLPTSLTPVSAFHQSLIQINMPTVYTIDLGTSYFFNNTAPDLSQAGTYNLYWEYDNIAGHWVCGCLGKGAAS